MTAEFDERLYLAANPDVARLLIDGTAASALEHWESVGVLEHELGLRRSGFLEYDVIYDEQTYLEQNEDVAHAVRSGKFRDGYVHWVRYGRHEYMDGRRAQCFGTMPSWALSPFRLSLPHGDALILCQAPRYAEVAGCALRHTDGTLEQLPYVVSAPVEIFLASGRPPRAVRLLLCHVPLGKPAKELSLRFEDGRLSIIGLDGASDAPRFEGMHAALAFCEAARQLAGSDRDAPLFMRSVANFAYECVRLPVEGTAEQRPCSFHVESALSIEGVGIFLRGWIFPSKLERCFAVCLETAESADITDALNRHSRRDVLDVFRHKVGSESDDLYGFFSLVRMPNASRLLDCHIMLTIQPIGGSERLGAPVQVEDLQSPIDAVKPVLAAVNPASPLFQSMLAEHVAPAVLSLWSRHLARLPRTLTRKQFGAPPVRPAATVVVPLYGRCDFMKFQLALFANDPDFRDAVELCYVIDDPRIIDAALDLAQNCAPQYGVPFALAYTGHNHGYAIANNLGASIASAPFLVLLNSDVMPKRSRWVSTLIGHYEDLPQCGVLGPKLLYPDGSVQHAGMRFERFPFWGGLYGNNHPGKGLPSDDERESPPRAVEAVTGACMVVSASCYRDLGGLTEEVILGDFEDSDFCLKAWGAGKKSWYVPSVELYHLERQSLPLLPNSDMWRSQLTVVNCWLQNKKWSAVIDELKRPSTRAPTAGDRRAMSGNGA